MRKFLLLIVSFWTTFSYGQSPQYDLSGIIGMPLSHPRNVAIDNTGNIYVVEWSEVYKYNSLGKFQMKVGIEIDDQAGAVFDVAIDKESNLYIVNYSYSRIQKYDAQGRFLLQFGSPGSADGQLNYPEGIAIDVEGNILVADKDNHRIQKFSNTGKFLSKFGSKGTANEQFDSPSDVEADLQGNIYVVDKGNNRVLKFDTFGRFLMKLSKEEGLTSDFSSPERVAVDTEGNIVVADNGNSRIQKFNAIGQFLTSIGEIGYGDGKIEGKTFGLGIDRAGRIYVPEPSGQIYWSRMQIFSPTGQFLSRFGRDGIKADQINYPTTVATDAAGNIYTVNNGSLYFVDSIKFIQKFNRVGNFILKFGSGGTGDGQFSSDPSITTDPYGNIYTSEINEQGSFVQKFDPTGKFIKKYSFFGADAMLNQLGLIAADKFGNIYRIDHYENCIRKINASGQFLFKTGSRGKGYGQLNSPTRLAVDQLENIYVLDWIDNFTFRILKFTPDGKFIIQYDITKNVYLVNASSFAVDREGNMFVGDPNYIYKFDVSGNFLFKFIAPNHAIAVSSDGNKVVAAYANTHSIYIYTSNTYVTPQENFITGTIYEDTDKNCQKDASEKGISGIVVTAEPGPYYGISDESGNYSIPVDTGAYTIRQLLPEQNGRTITQSCPATSHTARFTSYNNTIAEKDFGNQVSVAPYSSAWVTSNRRRRCFTNTTTVTYSNSGFAPATDVKVYVQLPQYVVFQSANKPYTIDSSGNYVFTISTLSPNQAGSIVIQDSVACNDSSIRGLTQCTKVWITPANTYPDSENWDQSDIILDGKCLENGVVRFAVTNKGQGNMADSLSLRIYLDAQLALNHSFKLTKGDSLVLRVPVNGRTIRLEADQHPNHPTKKQTYVTLEGCGLNANGTVSKGFVNAFATEDPEPEVAIDCQPIIDSFDPNDKGVIPSGITNQHYTPTNTALHYKIRFQNTGTDTAYRVVVVDTLSSHLDLSTLHMESVSHPYELSISGKGNAVLTWTFNNINLPDSTKDQLGSNGYLSFSIKPKAGLAEKELIENFSDIYFDYNEPVRTNTAVNRIYDMPLVVAPNIQLEADKVVTTPVINAFSPQEGRFGTNVTISGKNFAVNGIENLIRFNGKPASVIQSSSTSITVQVPNGATTGTISIQTRDGSRESINTFRVFQPPVITDFSPKEVKANTKARITIGGEHFSDNPAKDTVTINNLQAKIISATVTSLEIEVPEQAATGKLWIGTLGGNTQSKEELVIWHAPLISDISVDTAKIGAVIKITGKNFAWVASRNVVKLGETIGIVKQASATELQVEIPTDAQTGYVSIETPGGVVSSERKLVIIPKPVISHFTPKQGHISTEVTVHGRNFNTFSTQDTLYVNGRRATIRYSTDTTLTFRIPKGAETGKLSVYGIGGRTESADDFEVKNLSLDEAVSVYPNPSKGVFTIDYSKANFYSNVIRIYNAVGMQVYAQKKATDYSDKLVIELSDAPKGLYILVIKINDSTLSKKIYVQ